MQSDDRAVRPCPRTGLADPELEPAAIVGGGTNRASGGVGFKRFSKLSELGGATGSNKRQRTRRLRAYRRRGVSHLLSSRCNTRTKIIKTEAWSEVCQTHSNPD